MLTVSRRGRARTVALTIGAALALHAVFVVGLPWLILSTTSGCSWLALPIGPLRWLGVPLAAFGLYLYVWSLVQLLRRDTSALPGLAPTALDTSGWYGRTRNPLLLGVVAVQCGTALAAASLVLLAYALAYWSWLHLFVTRREEPDMERAFGDAYARYASEVPRWIPRRGGRSLVSLFLLLVALSSSGCGDGGSNAASQPAMVGAIEGFYGPPYSFSQRLDLLRVLPEAGLNTYVYAPKLDPYHRNRWRDPYPPEWLEHFHELASTADDLGLRFVFALSPGAGFDPDAGDQAVVEAKLATLLDRGVRHFCLFFDDLAPGGRAAEPAVQVALITDTLAFLRARDRDTSLCFISHYYAGTAAELRADRSPFDGMFTAPASAAYAAYAAIPRDVPILWTGPRVFGRLTVADTADYRAFTGRPVVIWDNFPVNDIVLSRELFLSPYRDREAGLTRVADGVLLNLMLQPEASKIALHTAGRFFATGARYDPEAALGPALAAVAGSDAGGRALARLAEQFHSHPLIGHVQESPRLAARTAAFLATRSADDAAALRALFAEFAPIEDDLARAVPNQALVAELAEAAHKLSLLAEAGLLALDLLDQQARGEPADDAQLCATLRAARAIPWLVAANSPIGSPLDQFLAGQDAERADVFGDFFAAVGACAAPM